MTKARNRSAYEQRCQEMEKLKPDAPLTVFMFDINNLKHTMIPTVIMPEIPLYAVLPTS